MLCFEKLLSSYGLTGKVDLSEMLFRMDDQIRQAKEEAQSRKDILDRVEKWKYAAEEENWLDEYEKVNLLRTYVKIK